VIRFADESMTDLMPMKEADYALLAQRLDAVIERRWDDSSLTRRLAISARQRLTGRVGVGRIDPTATVQKPIPLIILPFTPPTVKNGIEPVPVLSVVLERTEEE
jgi:hypothetical protein